MDDIFSSSNENQDMKKDSNIEWKNSGIDKNERITLKINIKEANEHNAKKKRDAKKKFKADKSLAAYGFKKIKKKIKGPLDEDEDEDDYIVVPVFMQMDESSLIRGLSQDEKKLLNQHDNIENIRLQENIGKQTAIMQAEKAIKDLGLKLDKKITMEKMAKNPKIESKEILEENLKKKKPFKHKQEQKVEKAKFDKEDNKAKTSEERALIQAKRRAQKKAENQQKMQEKTKEIKTQSEAKSQETVKIQEDLNIKSQEQQEQTKQETIQKDEQIKQTDIEQEEKLEAEKVKDEVLNKEEKSIKDIIMEKRGQKYPQSNTDSRNIEENKKLRLEEQLIKKYETER